jgi:hypothetical protein
LTCGHFAVVKDKTDKESDKVLGFGDKTLTPQTLNCDSSHHEL